MQPLKKVVVVGGGTAGWIAAAVLSKMLPRRNLAIELIESDEIGTIGVGESTIPPFMQVLKILEVDEQEFIKATQASFKLGISFVDWLKKGETYFHPFGATGAKVDGFDFFQCWLKAKYEGNNSELMDFSPCYAMAKEKRFFLPERAPKTPVASANYALHLDAKLVATFLRNYAEGRGVVRSEGIVSRVETKSNGFIEKLVLQDDREISGDFFIDCTGFSALLIGKTLDVGYEDWSNFLPCDKAVVVQTENTAATPPYTRATAHDAGWMWRIPLQHRAGNGYVYSSKYCSDEEARKTLLQNIEGTPLGEPRVIGFKTGVRKEIWKNNCLSLGLSAGFIEPLESTAIHLVVRGMDFFLRFFPDQGCERALIAEYNRRMTADYEEIRDFIVLHYCLTQRDDTDFWKHCKTMEIPAQLQQRIDLFKAHGGLREGVDELFRSESWEAVFEGMGVRPLKYNARIDNLESSMIESLLEKAKMSLESVVSDLPTHDEFIQKHCAAPPWRSL